MKRSIFIGLLLLTAIWLTAFEPHFAKDPDISPDGSEICFSYRGDLWKVPFDGGTAIRLTDTESSNYGPVYSPDGSKIAFDSNREGASGIYLIPSQGGEITRVGEFGFGLLDWFPDGKHLLASKYDQRYGTGFYKVSLDGKGASEITLIGGIFATISADGNSIVYTDRGNPYREAYQGSTNGELWRYDIKKKEYQKLTDTDLSERYSEYSRVNPNRLYYAKSDGEVFQLFRVENYDFENEEQLTDFPTWSVRDISIASNSDKIVFEKFDEIWSYDDTASGKKAKKVEIEIREVQDKSNMIRQTVIDSFDDFEVSPNEEFLVYNYKYDLFMMPTAGGPVKQITDKQIPYQGINILRDNKTVVVNGRERGEGELYKFSIDNPNELELIGWSKGKSIQSIAETEQGNFLISYYVDKNQQALAITDSLFSYFEPIKFGKYNIRSYANRQNSSYIAYVEYDFEKRISYLYLRDTEREKSYLLYNSYKSCYNLAWGKDDKSLFFSEDGDIKRIDLHPIDELADYKDPWTKIISEEEDKKNKEDKKEEEKKEDYPELVINLEGVESRIKTIVSLPGYNYIVSVVNDSTLYYANSNKSTTFYQINYDGKNSDKITTIESRDYSSYNPKTFNYYYHNGSKINSFNLQTKKTSEIGNSFFYEYDLNNVRQQVFREVWGVFGRSFYDPEMHGVNWEKLYKKYEPYIKYCYDEESLSNIVEEMIGEVNASHTGFYAKSYENSFSYQVGYIGADFDYSKRLKKGIKFRKIYDGTSLKDVYKLEAGDLLLAVNDEKITDDTDINSLFFNTQGRKIKLQVQKAKEKPFEMWVEGLTWTQNSTLEYHDWVNSRRKLVNDTSKGKLAYLHIRRMNYSSYQKFLEDFWNDNIKKDGFIIDVRGNGGGNISEELIDAIRKRPISYSSSRYWGDKKYKNPNRFYDKPIVVLIDEDSFSDAEVFPHLVKEQKLGTIIGMPTSGSVIGTYDVDLFDGSSLRLPRSGWWTLGGINMEGNGVQPDIRVDLSPEDRLQDNDKQLSKAIEYLLDK
ncbi:PD40 domain-containing protein [bacterium]|nr:PD40 domain-containing protein [bacterium]